MNKSLYFYILAPLLIIVSSICIFSASPSTSPSTSLLTAVTARAQMATSSLSSTSEPGERIFYYRPPESTVADFVAHAEDIDIIAPQTYEVTAALTATGTIPADLYAAALANHVKIMPLIANSNFSQVTMHNLLASTVAENNVVAYLVSTAKSQGYIGWQFDFEHISVNDRDAFSSFVEKTAVALHANNLILSVAVVVRTSDATSSDVASNNYYKNWSGAYDYTRIGRAADFVSIMTYDDPDSTGPSAPIDFTKSVLGYLSDKIPSNKISLGIPLFYWGWSVNPPVRIRSGGTYDMLESRRNLYRHTEGFNVQYGAPWLIYSIGKKTYIIWFENEQSISEKTALISTYKLRGFSAWVLGDEDPGIWGTL